MQNKNYYIKINLNILPGRKKKGTNNKKMKRNNVHCAQPSIRNLCSLCSYSLNSCYSLKPFLGMCTFQQVPQDAFSNAFQKKKIEKDNY